MARSRATLLLALLVTTAIGLSLTGSPSVSAAPAAGAVDQIGTTQPGAPAPAAGIASVSADTWTITVSGSLPSTDPAATALDIYELDPTQSAVDYGNTAPVATIAAPPTAAFRVSFPRFAGPQEYPVHKGASPSSVTDTDNS